MWVLNTFVGHGFLLYGRAIGENRGLNNIFWPVSQSNGNFKVFYSPESNNLKTECP